MLQALCNYSPWVILITTGLGGGALFTASNKYSLLCKWPLYIDTWWGVETWTIRYIELISIVGKSQNKGGGGFGPGANLRGHLQSREYLLLAVNQRSAGIPVPSRNRSSRVPGLGFSTVFGFSWVPVSDSVPFLGFHESRSGIRYRLGATSSLGFSTGLKNLI